MKEKIAKADISLIWSLTAKQERKKAF